MRCPECDSEIPAQVSLCLHCGAMVEKTQPSRAAGRSEPGTRASRPASAFRLRTAFLWSLGLVLLLLLGISAGVYLGVRQGEHDRVQRLTEEAERHYQRGLARLDQGNYELAQAEFEYALKLDPSHPLAGEGIAEAEARRQVVPVPTESPEEPITHDLFRQAEAHYGAERWQDAAATLTSLRQLEPDYERERVEEMLFESRYRAGMALLDDDDFELGIFFLDRAVALRPLDEEATTQRRLAMRYLEALNYWAIDWEECIERFEEIRREAPDYKDAFGRLHQAHVRYAEAWAAQGEMCQAADQYSEALSLLRTGTIEAKQAEAAEACRAATPTPAPGLVDTTPITRTALPPGFSTGRLAYPVYDTAGGIYSVYGVFADGRVEKLVSGADQPMWMWHGDALGFRDRVTPAISLLPAMGERTRPLVGGSSVAWPTFSPDGQRMAYAEMDSEGTWQIYIVPTDGSDEPRHHATGRGPVWGPTGLLAWTGCEADAPDVCGIFLDNPDDGTPGTRVSGSGNDISLSWAPGGNQVAYMSDHTGNWEIYIYDLGGGFRQLTDNSAADGLPAWSPDGSGIAFVSNRGDGWGIYLMGPGGEDPRPVLSLGANLPNWTMQRLSWAP